MDSHGYFTSQEVTSDGKRKHIKMHQLLFGKWVDHADRNKLNNRRYNIRPCTRNDNNHNVHNSNTANNKRNAGNHRQKNGQNIHSGVNNIRN